MTHSLTCRRWPCGWWSGLANHCFDLRVKRPMKQQICQRMKVIAAKEGLDVDNAAIEMLVESVGNDIRQVRTRHHSASPTPATPPY